MPKEKKSYTYSERGAYHAERAKKGSLATPEERAYSAGWLQRQKLNNRAYNYNQSKK